MCSMQFWSSSSNILDGEKDTKLYRKCTCFPRQIYFEKIARGETQLLLHIISIRTNCYNTTRENTFLTNNLFWFGKSQWRALRWWWWWWRVLKKIFTLEKRESAQTTFFRGFLLFRYSTPRSLVFYKLNRFFWWENKVCVAVVVKKPSVPPSPQQAMGNNQKQLGCWGNNTKMGVWEMDECLRVPL